MGDKHGSQWMRALPWVLLGKRVQVQPDLDASSAMLVFGKSLSLPGQVLGHPGPPLTNLQTKALLHELYRMSDKPAIQTTSITTPIDITATDNAKFVYVKNHEPKHGLAPRFDGPYRIVSRPSRSTVQVKVGVFADGRERLQSYHWTSCKVAHMREDAVEASRPALGRKRTEAPAQPSSPDNSAVTNKMAARDALGSPFSGADKTITNLPAEIQTSLAPSNTSGRPVRSTRNPNPQYQE